MVVFAANNTIAEWIRMEPGQVKEMDSVKNNDANNDEKKSGFKNLEEIEPAEKGNVNQPRLGGSESATDSLKFKYFWDKPDLR